MKTKYFLIPVLVLFVNIALSQSNDHFMSISMGASFPMDDFSSTSIDNENAGYAETSFGLAFDGAYLFTQNVGIGGNIGFSNNSVARNLLRDNLIQRIEEDYPDFEIPEDTQISFDVGAWNTINLMFGPHLTLPANQLNLDLRALAGFSFVLPPEFNILISNPEEDLRRKSAIKRSANFGYLLGGGFRYNTRSNTIIRIMVDYTNTKAKITLTDEVTEDNQTEEQNVRTVNQPISAVFVGIGIGYHF